MTTRIDEGLQVFDLTNLDWDHAPVCEARWGQGNDDDDCCENPAKFICVTRCCGKFHLLCEDCFFKTRDYLKKHGHKHFCLGCDNIIAEPWEDLLKIVGRV